MNTHQRTRVDAEEAASSAAASHVRMPCVLRSAGFTVIELVTSIVIIGILSALALPRMFGNQVFSERGYIDELAFTLRYAQKIAIASECEVAVTIGAAGYVAMQRAAAGNGCNPAGPWAVPVLRTDGSALSGAAPANVASAPATIITFDSTGGVGAAPPQLSVGAFTLNVNALSGMVTVLP